MLNLSGSMFHHVNSISHVSLVTTIRMYRDLGKFKSK